MQDVEKEKENDDVANYQRRAYFEAESRLRAQLEEKKSQRCDDVKCASDDDEEDEEALQKEERPKCATDVLPCKDEETLAI
jgi:hypothetical protein